MEIKDLRKQVERDQENILKAVLKFFKYHRNPVLGPSDITSGLSLFKGLSDSTIKAWGFTGRHNDKIAQGYINELLNRGQIKRIERPSLNTKRRWSGYQYKDN